MAFVPFNPVENIQRTRRKLPHWFQEGRTYFVTFRLADSMPREKREHLESQRDAWMHGKGLKSLDEIEHLSEEDRKEYHRIFTAKIHELLDIGYGSCVLREPENAKIVSNALMFFDGQRCEMISFVVMPNHVHVLTCPIEPHRLSELLHSWKRFTSREIHKRTGVTGTLWLDENFDHIVRSEHQLEHFRNYIRDNPKKARLPKGTVIHYDKESGTGLQPVRAEAADALRPNHSSPQ
jgi:REP element-mobilizing transposase RayT